MKGYYYVFLKEEQRRSSKCFTTLSWGGGTGNGLFQGFPRDFLGLEQAGSPHKIILIISIPIIYGNNEVLIQKPRSLSWFLSFLLFN